MMRETVLQFGTGNFLRAFFDPFLDKMQKQGLYEGSAVIVSPTDSAAVEKLNRQNCRYHLLVRGVENGRQTAEIKKIESVSRAINPYRDFNAFLALAKQPDLRFIVSNTTEAGIAFDGTCRFDDAPQTSFPGKLTRFLYERYINGLPGFILLPCELIDLNGDQLKTCVEKYISLWELPEAFSRWVESENVFCNTLVDRIVTGYPADADDWFKRIGCEDVLLDTAEPYHLWVIEGDFEKELPLRAAGFNVVWTNDAAPYKKMKVRILNGMHTSMVFPGLLAGLESVCDCMNDNQMRRFAEQILEKRILPTLENTPQISAFAAAVTERFENPYLHHKLQSISLNSVSKFTVRILPSLNDNVSLTGDVPREFALSLASLIAYYKTHPVQDEPAAAAFIKNNSISEILKNQSLWGQDLSFMKNEVVYCFELIEKNGIREAIGWSLT